MTFQSFALIGALIFSATPVFSTEAGGASAQWNNQTSTFRGHEEESIFKETHVH